MLAPALILLLRDGSVVLATASESEREGGARRAGPGKRELQAGGFVISAEEEALLGYPGAEPSGARSVDGWSEGHVGSGVSVYRQGFLVRCTGV